MLPDLNGAASGLAEDEFLEAGGAVLHALQGGRPGHSSVADSEKRRIVAWPSHRDREDEVEEGTGESASFV